MNGKHLMRAKLAVLAVAAAFLLASCFAPVFVPFNGQRFGEDPAADEDLIIVNDENGNSQLLLGFIISDGSFEFVNEASQKWFVEFQSVGGGDLFIDQDTILSALTVYPVTDPTEVDDAGELLVRGAPLSNDVDSVVNEGNSTVVRGTIDLSNLTTDTLELVIDPTVLTANGGTTFLDIDGDGVPGEPQDDLVIVYTNDDADYFQDIEPGDILAGPSVAQSLKDGAATIVRLDEDGIIGDPRLPRALVQVPVYESGPVQDVDGTPEIEWGDVDDTDPENVDTATNLDAATVAAAIAVQSMGETVNDWTDVDMGTPAIGATTQEFTYDYATAPATTADGTVYRSIVTPEAIVENVATLGFVHKGGLNSAPIPDIGTPPVYSYWFVGGGEDSWDSIDANIFDWNDKESNGIYYFDIDFQGDTDSGSGVDLDTLSNSTLYLVQQGYRGGGSLPPIPFNWERYEVLNPEDLNLADPDFPWQDISEVRFYMPAGFTPYGDRDGDGTLDDNPFDEYPIDEENWIQFELWVTPGLKNGNDDVSTDDRNEAEPFGDPNVGSDTDFLPIDTTTVFDFFES